jgi:uncharacterized protein (TIGR02118 family)
MPVSLLALYHRPAGGEEAMETFRRRYAAEHLPLVRQTPGLRSISVDRVSHAFQESDVVLVAMMVFDSRTALDAGLASEPMRQAGRNLRDIAPDGYTLLVLEPEPTALEAHDSTLHGLYEERMATAEAEPAAAGQAATDEGDREPIVEGRQPMPDNRAAEREVTGEAWETPDTSIPRDAERR